MSFHKFTRYNDAICSTIKILFAFGTIILEFYKNWKITIRVHVDFRRLWNCSDFFTTTFPLIIKVLCEILYTTININIHYFFILNLISMFINIFCIGTGFLFVLLWNNFQDFAITNPFLWWIMCIFIIKVKKNCNQKEIFTSEP